MQSSPQGSLGIQLSGGLRSRGRFVDLGFLCAISSWASGGDCAKELHRIPWNCTEFHGIPCRVWESGTPCWPELLEPELAAESTVGLGHPVNYMENLISAHKWRQPINQMENLTSAHRWRCRRGEMRGEQSSFVFCAHPPKQAGYELVPLFTHNGCCDFFRCHSFSFGEFSLMKELSKGFHKSGWTFDF